MSAVIYAVFSADDDDGEQDYLMMAAACCEVDNILIPMQHRLLIVDCMHRLGSKSKSRCCRGAGKEEGEKGEEKRAVQHAQHFLKTDVTAQ